MQKSSLCCDATAMPREGRCVQDARYERLPARRERNVIRWAWSTGEHAGLDDLPVTRPTTRVTRIAPRRSTAARNGTRADCAKCEDAGRSVRTDRPHRSTNASNSLRSEERRVGKE